MARRIRAIAAAALTFVGSAIGINTAHSASGGIMGKMVYVETEEVADTTATQDTLVEPAMILMGGIAPADSEQDAVEPMIYEVMGEMTATPEPAVDTEPVDDIDHVTPDTVPGEATEQPVLQATEPMMVITLRHAQPEMR